MAQRKALAVAGAISVTAMSAALAIGANFGLFGLAASPDARVGTFTAANSESAQADPAGTTEPLAAPSTEPGGPPATPLAAEAAPLEAPVEFAPALPGEPAQAAEHRSPNAPESAPPAVSHHDDADHDDGSGHGRNRGRGGDDARDDDSDDDRDEVDDDD